MSYTLKLAVATHLLLWGVCHGAPQGVSGEEYISGGDERLIERREGPVEVESRVSLW